MPELVTGRGAVSNLAKLIPDSVDTVLLVRGTTSYGASGADLAVSPQLAGLDVTEYVVRGRLPTFEEANDASGASVATPDLVIAVGGGLVIDQAKLLCMTLLSPLDPSQVSEAAQRPAIPLIAVPTTAGSGSERTPFAVAYEGAEKHSVASEGLAPVGAIVDPDLAESLSAVQRASSGFDAFAHAMESIWAVGATAETARQSSDALSEVWVNLEEAVLGAERSEARTQMSLASSAAGAAIAITRTTAAHAFSYYVTAEFGVPHGAAVGLTLGAMLEFNAAVSDSDCLDPRGPGRVQDAIHGICDLLGASSPVDARGRILEFQSAIGLPTVALDVGVDESRLTDWANSANVERLSNNPRSMSPDVAARLLETVL